MSNSEAKKPWFEPVSFILMAVASILTAWCSYESSVWSQQSNDLQMLVAKLDRQANEQHLDARQIEAMQTRFWMEVVDAHLDGDEKLERFYADRLADELKPAYEKWIAQKPYDNPAAPPHPFVPGLYTPRFEKEIREARAEGARAQVQSDIAEHYDSIYLSCTVMLAIVLFFAATAEKFAQSRVRLASLGFAIALFIYAAVRVFMLPVA